MRAWLAISRDVLLKKYCHPQPVIQSFLDDSYGIQKASQHPEEFELLRKTSGIMNGTQIECQAALCMPLYAVLVFITVWKCYFYALE